MKKKNKKPPITIPIDYKGVTYDQLIELIMYSQEELSKRGFKTRCSEDTILQKFIR